jgi:hypothetical protein
MNRIIHVKTIFIFLIGIFQFGCTIPETTTSVATIKTSGAKNITMTSAEIMGELINEGCLCTAINRGFIISDKKTNLIASGTVLNIGDGLKGSYTANLTKLKSKTTYYFVAYALNDAGKTYSLLDSFTTKSPDIDTLIVKPKSFWEYTFTPPPSTWKTTFGTWTTGQAPFGSLKSTGKDSLFNFNTLWPPVKTLYVRTKINLENYDPNSLTYYLGVDNGYELYVNGNFVSKGYADGYTYRWEYSGKIPPAFLKPGDNIIALILVDTGGYTAFDLQLTGKEK